MSGTKAELSSAQRAVAPINCSNDLGRVLGVLGGMGPAATVDFLRKVTEITPTSSDQEHIKSITCCIPDIPDRTNAILAGGASPLPAMLRSLSILEICGASRVAIPCNTAHHWYDAIQAETSLPLFHIVDSVRRDLSRADARSSVIGLLATTATVQARIYSDRLAPHGIDCISPSDRDQERVMRAIRQVKAGLGEPEVAMSIRAIAEKLRRRGASTIVLACSELPLLFPDAMEGMLDATAALARECVEWASGAANDAP